MGWGGEKGAGLMPCYEMLKVMWAWPGPSEICGLSSSAQLLVWDIRASPDAIVGLLGHLHPRGQSTHALAAAEASCLCIPLPVASASLWSCMGNFLGLTLEAAREAPPSPHSPTELMSGAFACS